MSSKNKWIKEVHDMIEEQGAKVISCVPTNNNHIKYKTTLPDGNQCMFIAAKSPSDHRGFNNLRSDVRRMVKLHPKKGNNK